jgi:hypothetical protein
MAQKGSEVVDRPQADQPAIDEVPGELESQEEVSMDLYSIRKKNKIFSCEE